MTSKQTSDVKKLALYGKFSLFISQFFRYIIIVILLTIIGVGTAGIGVFFGLVIIKAIQKAIPFRISIHNDFLMLVDKKIRLDSFNKSFNKKAKYNIIIIVSVLVLALATFNSINSIEDIILFSVLFGIIYIFLIYQIIYFSIVKKYVNEHSVLFVKNEDLLENKNAQVKTALNFDTQQIENKYSSVEQDTRANKEVFETENSKLTKQPTIISKMKSMKLSKLSSDEIIIISVIIGLVVALILGFNFGETYYFTQSGNRARAENYFDYKEFHFQYLFGIVGFIITSGISYIYLNRKNKKNE